MFLIEFNGYCGIGKSKQEAFKHMLNMAESEYCLEEVCKDINDVNVYTVQKEESKLKVNIVFD